MDNNFSDDSLSLIAIIHWFVWSVPVLLFSFSNKSLLVFVFVKSILSGSNKRINFLFFNTKFMLFVHWFYFQFSGIFFFIKILCDNVDLYFILQIISMATKLTNFWKYSISLIFTCIIFHLHNSSCVLLQLS